MFFCSHFVGLLQLFAHWHQLWSDVQAAKSSKPRCFFLQEQTWACQTTAPGTSLAATQRQDYFYDSHFCFPFFIISEYTPRTLRSSSDGEKPLLVQDGNLWATGCSLFRLTVQNLFQNFSLYFCLPWNTLTLSQALDTFNLDFAASIFIDWCVWWWLFCGGGFFVLFVCCFLFYFLFLGWVDWGGERQRWKQWVVRLCACVCVCGGGGGAVCNALLN